VEKRWFFPHSCGPVSSAMQAPAADDAGSIVSVYVQISLSVTKVLIRKRF
jgi:hypothetical protein